MARTFQPVVWFTSCKDSHGERPELRPHGEARRSGLPIRSCLMAESGTLHRAFVDELRNVYDGEKQLTKALPKLAKAAHSPLLRTAFDDYLEETHVHIERLERVFANLD